MNIKKSIELHTNLSLSYLPMRENTVRQIYDSIRYHLPLAQKKYRISVFSDKQEIRTLVPNFYRQSKKDKNRMISHKVKPSLVTNFSAPENSFDKGLTNNHIALWQSMVGIMSRSWDVGSGSGRVFFKRWKISIHRVMCCLFFGADAGKCRGGQCAAST